MYELEQKADNGLEEFEDLFENKTEQEVTPTSEPGEKTPEPEKVNETKRVAERIKAVKTETELETKNNIAKDLGYESYQDMLDKRHKKELEEKGYDPNDLEPIIEKRLDEKIKSDPRFRELEELQNQKLFMKANQELLEIQKFNPNIKTLEDLSPEVFELGKTTGSLKKAYLAIEGEKLIINSKSQKSIGSTDHLSTPKGNPKESDGTRGLTQEERSNYKYFNPDMTDEQLDKIRKKL